MANEDLGLKLTAEVSKYVAGLQKAAAESESLAAVVLRVEKQIVASLARIELAARASLGKTTAAFVTGEAKIGEASTEIAADAGKVGAAMTQMGAASEKGAAKFATAAGKVKGAAGGIGDAVAAGAGGANRPITELGARFDALGERVRGSILNIQNAVLGLGALRFGQAAVGAASEFEAALGQVNIVAGDSGKSIQELQGFLLDLSKTTPVGLVDLTKSLGDAIGTLPKGANQAAVAMEALDAAQSAARASGSTAQEVLQGIIPILNVYGDTGIKARDITDKLFATFDAGGATVPQLSASLAQIIPLAKGFGLSLDEVLGEIVALTQKGFSASEAITNLRQAFVSTAAGGDMDKVAKQLQSLGLDAQLFSAASLKKNGLIGVLKQVRDAGGEGVLDKLFTDVQGKVGVMALFSAGLEQVETEITRVGQASGKTDAAVAVIAQNFDQLAGIAKNRLAAVMIDIGERIMPTVSRVLGQLADYAEKNGPQIAESIGKAVDALARFGEFVVSYGPEILTFLAAVKGTSWFVGLANDIAGAALALRTFSQGLAASDALGKGLASLGEQGGKSFLGGMKDSLKGAGGVVSSALKSPGIAAAIAGAFTIGYEIGSAMMDALGDAIEEGTQRQIRGAIDALDAEISGRLKDIGAKSVQEAADIRKRITGGQAVQTAPGKVQTLAEVKAGGGDVQAAFNAGLTAIAQQVDAAQAASARNVAAMGDAAAMIAELERRKVGGQELADAQAEFTQQQAAVRASAQRIADLTAGSQALVSQYAAVQGAAVDQTKAAAAAGAATASAASSSMRKAAKGAESDIERIAQEVIDLYREEAAKLADLRAEQRRLVVEGATAEVEARRAAFDAETQAHESMLSDINASEEQLARYRRDREAELSKIVADQADAIRRAADLRIEEATRAADAEAEKYRGSAEIQAQIAANLTAQIANINADATARAEELRIAAANRVADAERDLAAKTADTITKQLQGALDQAQRAFGDPGAFQPMQPGAEPAGPVAGAAADIGGIGGGAVGGAIAILPAINDVAAAGAGFFGGDVAGLREKARKREAEAAALDQKLAADEARRAEIQRNRDEADRISLRAAEAKQRGDATTAGRLNTEATLLRRQATVAEQGGLSEEEKAALQERADAARAEADAFRQSAEDAKGGLETFFEDLFANLEAFFVGWLDGLPQAIDRIVNEGLPAFIEAVIGNLPKIIVGFVTLAPRIAFAIIKSLVYSLPIAIYRGFKDAGSQIVELLTSDIGQAVINAFVGVGEYLYAGIVGAFSAAGDAIVAGIEAVFAPIVDFFSAVFDTAGGLFSGDDSTTGRIGRSLGLSAGAKILSGDFDKLSEKDIPIIGGFFHTGGSVSASQSDPHSAAIMAAAGAPRFADGGMVRRLDSLARRRMSQVLSGDDVPALLSPGEGVLTRQGVAAVGGAGSLDAINRGNAPAAGGGVVPAQVVLSARIGGDRALAALVSRIVSVSMATPGGAVRTAIDDSNRATSYPGVSFVR